jgi:dipeptidyl aminopeptidase/acylaminoacyl peptidase
MRTGRPQTVIWFCLLATALALSGCFSGPSKAPAPEPDWLSAETTKELPGVVIEKVTYKSGDLIIVGQVCRPAGDGPYPVIISNHGGFEGLPDWDDPNGFCVAAAKAGWALAESSYRGEDGSGGRVEVCLGEVDDVLAMLDVVRTQSYADPQRIAMIGVSHGGCITLRAVERGADVDLAIDIAGPTDWNSLMPALKRSAKDGSASPEMQRINQGLADGVEKAVGGSSVKYPDRYASRSPNAAKIAQWDKPLLIMHGGADTIVPVQQSCAFADEIGDVKAYRLDASGDVDSQPPAGCKELTWNGPPTPVGTFNADRYLLTYDGVDHFLAANNGLGRMTSDFLEFIEAKLPG